MITDDSHYLALAAAYVRGVVGDRSLDVAAAVARGERDGLRLHRFERTSGLPRVRAVLGALRGFGATSVIDLGSGRGMFVWPLLDGLPGVTLTATDLLEHRVQAFAQVARGGIERLHAVHCDATALPFADDAADCVTALEVLEHMPGEQPALAAREAVRVARTDGLTLYGEWLYAKHTIFYDRLPHYCLEFDIRDRSHDRAVVRSRPDGGSRAGLAARVTAFRR